MDKIEVSQRAREAYLAMEKPYKKYHAAVLGGQWDNDPTIQELARFERDILATRTDATPVTWMPIDSAPTDWDDVVVYSPDHAGFNCGGVFLAFCDPDDDIWYAHGPSGNIRLHPTHWQPLPAAPDHIEESRAMVYATDVAALVEHFRRIIEACANYVEPTTYIARHPTGELCKWDTEFPEPDRHQSIEGALARTRRRDQAFISDMIYMLDGPEQRAALAPFTKGQNDDA